MSFLEDSMLSPKELLISNEPKIDQEESLVLRKEQEIVPQAGFLTDEAQREKKVSNSKVIKQDEKPLGPIHF